MNKSKHDRQHNAGQGQEGSHPRGPYWTRVHHHWYFWVGMVLFLVAIVNYVMTEDLSWWPHSQP